jgi:hypothetical protein
MKPSNLATAKTKANPGFSHEKETEMSAMLRKIIGTVLMATLLVLAGAPAAHARFLTPDTYDPWEEGVGTNRYSYSGNDPINGSDPNGHQNENSDLNAFREFVRNFGVPSEISEPTMVPSEDIRFSQDSIKSYFKGDQISLKVTIEHLKRDPSFAERLPPIKIVSTPYGDFVIEGNRRLAAAKKAGVMVKVIAATPEEIDKATRVGKTNKFTSTTGGSIIKVRGTNWSISSFFSDGETLRRNGPRSPDRFLERMREAIRQMRMNGRFGGGGSGGMR